MMPVPGLSRALLLPPRALAPVAVELLLPLRLRPLPGRAVDPLWPIARKKGQKGKEGGALCRRFSSTPRMGGKTRLDSVG